MKKQRKKKKVLNDSVKYGREAVGRRIINKLQEAIKEMGLSMAVIGHAGTEAARQGRQPQNVPTNNT